MFYAAYNSRFIQASSPSREGGSAAEVLGEDTLQKARKVHLSEPAGKPGPACGWSFPARMGEFGLFVPVLQKRSSLRTSLHGQYEHPASDFPMAREIGNIVQPHVNCMREWIRKRLIHDEIDMC